MNDHEDDDTGSELSPAEQRSVKALFEQRLRNEPPLDWPALSQRFRRRIRARRNAAIGGIAGAVVLLATGAAIVATHTAGPTPSTSTSTVPGCDTVVATNDPVVSAWQSRDDASALLATTIDGSVAVSTGSSPSWFTPTVAAAWSASFRAALPAGVQMTTGPDGLPLPFDVSAGPSGDGVLTAGSVSAKFEIDVQPWNGGQPPPCTSDMLLRTQDVTGTVTDVRATSPVSWIAESYRVGGTQVSVTLQGQAGGAQAALPLTAQQLAALAADPGLAINVH